MCVYINTHSRPLYNMSLNCVGSLIGGFFSIIITTMLYDPWLAEYAVVENMWIQRTNCKLHVDFWLWGGLTPLTPMLFKGQQYIICVVCIYMCIPCVVCISAHQN